MGLTPAEQKVCETLNLTEEEYLASRIGVTPEAYRATKAAKALTPLQLEAAKRMGITPEKYAAHVEPAENGE
jgi:hypothetical protein